MKNDYESELHNFFRRKENFEMLLKVSSHLDPVLESLMKEFWELVIEKLKIKFNNLDGKWEIGFSDDWAHSYNKVRVNKIIWREPESIPMVSISFERLTHSNHAWFGITINRDSEVYDPNSVKEAIKNLPGAKSYTTDSNAYWALWKHLTFNFSKMEDRQAFT